MIKQKVRVNLYNIIERAVDEGISYGYNRSFKHNDQPDVEVIKEQIHTAVMNAICEVVDFGDNE